ncbi:LTA synthase family protein [Limosilactobacillus sp.]|uniref:LTA synthase family protein n=1 Tax=Limosilactobacillus sp. TaxID=2773925 RepID=UPI0025C0AB7D|nr:LTA synthase family protein [Limosilactobacillus sp.]MCH3922813.1 LTA synthase family protein [Limosilactobacillus sp.]MCH3927496.1 LTA synthase family protein [Limosilactobacillus sp.]
MRNKVKLSWPLLIYGLLVLLAFWGTVLHWQTGLLQAGSIGGLAGWELLKVLGGTSAIIIPMLVGYYQGPIHRRWPLALGYGLVGAVTFSLAHWLPSGGGTTERYLVQQIFITWLGTLLLWMAAPVLHRILHRWQAKQRRTVILALIGVFLVLEILGWQMLLGFAGGRSLVWLAFLFTIGDWLATDRAWWQRFSRWFYLVLGLISWLLTALTIWLHNSRVDYNPHRGLLVDHLHQLIGIAPCQPLLLITSVLLLMAVGYHHLAISLADLGRGILTLNLLGIPLAFAPVASKIPWLLCWIVLTAAIITGLPLLFERLFADVSWTISGAAIRRWAGRVIRFGWPLLLTYLILWLLTVASFALLWNNDWTMVTWAVTKRAAIININTLMIFAICLVLMAITNRWWLSSGITIAFYIGWIVASQLKIAAREEPILPTDMSTLTAPKEMLGMVDSKTIVAVVGGAILLLGVCAWLEHRYGHPRLRWWGRLGVALVAVLFLGSFTRANHSNSLTFKQLQKYHDIPYFYKQIRGAQMNGTLLQFANNIDVHVMTKPVGYSAARMHQIEQRYTTVGAKINQDRQHGTVGRQNLVFVLSESFADPSRVPGMKVHGGDPLPFLHQLEKHTTSGLMLSSGYGGGTANMEYQALTGLAVASFSPTMPTPYSQLVPYQKRAWSINQLFNYSIGIHPFTANLYSRKTVYHKFGFAKFYHFGSADKLTYTKKIYHNPKVSDDSTYKEITLNLRRQPHGKFVQVATMQNHMPYQNYYRHNHYSISGDNFSEGQENSIETYIQGIHYTDTALKSWIHQLDELDQPTTVVWYGDHLPGIYNKVSMSKYGVPLHETDYFIYSNKAARRLNHDRIVNQHQLVSPNVFGALALAKMDMKVSPYYALLTKVSEEIPATSLPLDGSSKNNTAHQGGISFVDQHGKEVKLNAKQRQLYHDYQLVQYDLTAGHGYLMKDRFLKSVAK